MAHVTLPPCSHRDAPDPRRATGTTLNWGVVSTGHIARAVAQQLAQLEDARLHAVSSRSEESAASFASDFDIARAYHDADGTSGLERLACDPDVDVVYVATPHAQHHAAVRRLLEAGKHVLVEKAFTVNASEAHDLVRLARDRHLFLMEALWTRFLPSYRHVVERLEAGAIGRPAWLQADLGMPLAFDPASRMWAREAGGGALLDLAVYPLAWTVAVFGLPVSVRANGTLARNGVDALAALTLDHADGSLAQVVVSFTARHRGSVAIAGSEGTLCVGAPMPNPDRVVLDRGDDTHAWHSDQSVPGHCFQLREVTRCVQADLAESPTMPLRDSLAVMERLDEARRALGVRYPNDDAVLPDLTR